MISGIRVNDRNEMGCPLCGGTNVHLRPKDTTASVSRLVGREASSQLALHAWCEDCLREFECLFTTHDGRTVVEHFDHGAVEGSTPSTEW